MRVHRGQLRAPQIQEPHEGQLPWALMALMHQLKGALFGFSPTAPLFSFRALNGLVVGAATASESAVFQTRWANIGDLLQLMGVTGIVVRTVNVLFGWLFVIHLRED